MLFVPRSWYLPALAKKPAGRLTHEKALAVMASVLGLTVHQFLHIQPVDAIRRLKLANTEEDAYRMLGDNTNYSWWLIGGRPLLPCCVACVRAPGSAAPNGPAPAATPAAAPAPEPSPAYQRLQERLAALAPAPAAAPVLGQMRESILEYLKEAIGAVDAYDHLAITDILMRFKGRTV